MGMKITLEINDPAVVTAIMRLLAEDTFAVQADTPDVERQSAPEKPRAGTAAALLNDPTQPGQGGQSASAKLIASTSMKRAQTVTLAGGAKGKDGDIVVTESGEEGMIVACYRGKAILEFEDATAEMYDAPSLSLVPQEDEDPLPPGGLEEPASDELLSSEKVEALKGKANGLVASKRATPDEIFKLLGQYGAGKFQDLPARAFTPMDRALDELAAMPEPTSHGF